MAASKDVIISKSAAEMDRYCRWSPTPSNCRLSPTPSVLSSDSGIFSDSESDSELRGISPTKFSFYSNVLKRVLFSNCNTKTEVYHRAKPEPRFMTKIEIANYEVIPSVWKLPPPYLDNITPIGSDYLKHPIERADGAYIRLMYYYMDEGLLYNKKVRLPLRMPHYGLETKSELPAAIWEDTLQLHEKYEWEAWDLNSYIKGLTETIYQQIQHLQSRWAQTLDIRGGALTKWDSRNTFNIDVRRRFLMNIIIDHMIKPHGGQVCGAALLFAGSCVTKEQLAKHKKKCTFRKCPLCLSPDHSQTYCYDFENDLTTGIEKKPGRSKSKKRSRDEVEELATAICSNLRKQSSSIDCIDLIVLAIHVDVEKYQRRIIKPKSLQKTEAVKHKCPGFSDLRLQDVEDILSEKQDECGWDYTADADYNVGTRPKKPKVEALQQEDEEIGPLTCSQHYSLADTPPISASCKIDARGGLLTLEDVGATLSFPDGAVEEETIEATVSTCTEDDFPPFRSDQILMCPIIKCGPPGATFKKPATLEIDHEADVEEACGGEQKTTVWCKDTREGVSESEWVRVFDEGKRLDPDIDVKVSYNKLVISTTHFTKFGTLFGGGPTDYKVLMFMFPPCFSDAPEDNTVYVKVVLALQGNVKSVVEKEQTNGWHTCSGGTVFEVQPNGKPLRIGLKNIEPSREWDLKTRKQVVKYKFLQKGGECTFKFIKRNQNVKQLNGIVSIQQDGNDYQVPETHFDSIFIPLKVRDPKSYELKRSLRRSGDSSIAPSPALSFNPPSAGSGYMTASSEDLYSPQSMVNMLSPPPSVKEYERENIASTSSFQSHDPTDQDQEESSSPCKVKRQSKRSTSSSKRDSSSERTQTNQDQEESSSPCKVKRQSKRSTSSSKRDSSSERTQTSIHSDILPDSGGFYTDHQMKAAWPSQEQFQNKEKFYTMSKCEKGQALVINNCNFTSIRFAQKRRTGSEVDVINVTHLLENLGYRVHAVKVDLKAKEIVKAIGEFSQSCDQDPNCLSAFLFLMSHGESGSIFGTDGIPVKLKTIERKMDDKRCPGLKDKPKLIFVQACRVPPSSHGYDEHYTSDEDDTNNESQNNNIPQLLVDIPEHSHMYLAHATVDGCMSMRNTVQGSWFIQALCEMFFAHAHEDNLDELMTKVSNHVSKFSGKMNFGGQIVDSHQMPERISCLLKTLYFLPGFPPKELTGNG